MTEVTKQIRHTPLVEQNVEFFGKSLKENDILSLVLLTPSAADLIFLRAFKVARREFA